MSLLVSKTHLIPKVACLHHVMGTGAQGWGASSNPKSVASGPGARAVEGAGFPGRDGPAIYASLASSCVKPVVTPWPARASSPLHSTLQYPVVRGSLLLQDLFT